MRFLLVLFALLLPAASSFGEDLVIPFELHPRERVILVRARVNGRDVRLILDTGSPSTLVASDATNDPVNHRSRFAQSGIGLEVHGQWTEADFEIGTKRWRRRNIGVIDFAQVREVYGRDVDGILGQDLLAEFDSVRVDYRKKTLTLSRE